MSARSLSIGRAISVSWTTFLRYPGLTIGGFLIYNAITYLISAIPFVGGLASLVVVPALLGGIYIFDLNLVRNNNPKLEDLFAGFNRYIIWLGLYWLWLGVMLLALIPAGIGLLVAIIASGGANTYNTMAAPPGYGMHQPSFLNTIPIWAWGVLAIGIIVSFVIIVILSVRYIFAWYVAADGEGIIESFKRSSELTEGKRLRLFWIFIVIGLFSVAGVIALGIGILFTMMLSWLAYTSIYINLLPEQTAQAQPGLETTGA